MINKWRQLPVYLILLPAFFVLHGFKENFGFIEWYDALLLLVTYWAVTAGLFLLLRLFIKDKLKAGLLTFLISCFYFFFGAIHDFFKQFSPVAFFSSYSFLLLFLPVGFLFVFMMIKRKETRLKRFTSFANLLLCIYLLSDSILTVIRVFSKTGKKFSTYQFEKKLDLTLCKNCEKPSIYFLLFDEYPSSVSLKERYRFNNPLDSILKQKGFQIQTASNSNYNFTPFSIASILNMSYVEGIPNVKSVTAKDYSNCANLIRNNEVIQFLDMQGYEILNYSIFDLAGNPSVIYQQFLPLKTRLITEQTFFSRLNKDLGWILMKYFPFSLIFRGDVESKKNNKRILALVKGTINDKLSKPKFVYSHLNMPHAPYYFDSSGNEKPMSLVMEEFKTNPAKPFLQYLVYTNKVITDLVDTIQRDDPAAIIIIMGDHGYRTNDNTGDIKRVSFQNLNAVYLPPQYGSVFYDSITGVNQFRVLFNSVFKQQIPLLKDSTVYMLDEPPL
jgi:hypothetical protein